MEPGHTRRGLLVCGADDRLEPIRTPVGIQPRGALLVVCEADLRVAYASDNLGAYLGLHARDAVGRPLDELGTHPLGETARSLLERNANGRPTRLELAGGRIVDVFAHRSGEHVIIELEDVHEGRTSTTSDVFPHDVLDTLARFRHAESVDALLEAAVSVVRDLTGFDRVLAYRFEPGGHAVVARERHAVGLEPLLGRHVPASDIPPEARELDREQWIRVVPDSSLDAIELIGPAGSVPASTIDLSAAELRPVSPIHLQYLRSMDVRASLSVSLVVEGACWGLIVCHHYAGPMAVSYAVRAACEVVGMTTSMSIGNKAELAVVERRLALERVGAALLERVAGAPSIGEGLFEDPDLLLGVCGATGVAVRIGGALRRSGRVPSEQDVDRIHRAVRERLAGGGVYATDRLSLDHPELADVSSWASGVLAMNLSHDGANAIFWFRPERISTITWAGAPRATVEIVRQRAAPWGVAEVAAVRMLSSSLGSYMLEREEQLAFALESTRRYEREHYVAQTLRENVRPAPLPATPNIEMAARYLPAGEGYGVSGDFLEVFPADDGWFAVIGDVCGKGPRAAGLTVLARHTLRAVVLQDPSIAPSRAMLVLNAAFMDQAGGLFASVQVVRISARGNGSAQVTLCSAGHPPALHRHGSTVTPRSSSNILVGARRGPAYDDVEIELEPADALVLYTDGVTEAGRPGALFGEPRLAAAIAATGQADSDAIVEAIERAVRAHQVGDLRDDIAILCLRGSR